MSVHIPFQVESCAERRLPIQASALFQIQRAVDALKIVRCAPAIKLQALVIVVLLRHRSVKVVFQQIFVVLLLKLRARSHMRATFLLHLRLAAKGLGRVVFAGRHFCHGSMLRTSFMKNSFNRSDLQRTSSILREELVLNGARPAALLH